MAVSFYWNYESLGGAYNICYMLRRPIKEVSEELCYLMKEGCLSMKILSS